MKPEIVKVLPTRYVRVTKETCISHATFINPQIISEENLDRTKKEWMMKTGCSECPQCHTPNLRPEYAEGERYCGYCGAIILVNIDGTMGVL